MKSARSLGYVIVRVLFLVVATFDLVNIIILGLWLMLVLCELYLRVSLM